MITRSVVAGTLAAVLIAAPSAFAQTTPPAECTALWKQADASASGGLTKAQAQGYVTDFSAVDTDKDGKITNAEFMKGCSDGHVRKMGAASGTTGSSGSSGASGSGSSGSSGAQPPASP